MEKCKEQLIENCMLCEGELKPASEGPNNHLYADYFYDETNETKTVVGVHICPTCKFVLSDTRHFDGPFYSVSFAYNDRFLDDMHTTISERAFEACNENDPNFKKLVKKLDQIKQRINDINNGKIHDPF